MLLLRYNLEYVLSVRGVPASHVLLLQSPGASAQRPMQPARGRRRTKGERADGGTEGDQRQREE